MCVYIYMWIDMEIKWYVILKPQYNCFLSKTKLLMAYQKRGRDSIEYLMRVDRISAVILINTFPL